MTGATINKDTISILDGSVEIPKDYILAKTYCTIDDVVLVSGTLIEGMGNTHSDLDIYVLCDKRPNVADYDLGKHVAITNKQDELIDVNSGGEIYTTYDYFGNDGLHIDIKYITKDELSEIFSEIRREFVERTSETNIYYTMYDNVISYEALKLMHRLKVGVPLRGLKQWRTFIEGFPEKEFRFNLFHKHLIDYFIFKDIQGAYVSNNLELAVQICRNVMHSQILGLTFLCGNTNNTEKWIFHYVRKHLSKENKLASRYIDLWFRGAEDEDRKRLYVHESLKLIDDIFDQVRLVFVSQYGSELVSKMTSNIEAGAKKRKDSDHILSQEAIILRKKNFVSGQPSILSLVDKVLKN